MNPEVPYSNTYNIDGSNSEMYVQPYFVSYSPNCPAFCSLYEGHAFDLTTLSEASHPALTRFSHQTGQVVIATNENSFAGETLLLTIECVASRQYFGYFKVEFEVTFTIPNGCLISFDNSNSLILEDQMIVWGEQTTMAPFEPYTYESEGQGCTGHVITYEAVELRKDGTTRPLPNEILFYPDTRVFEAKKCVLNDPDSLNDPECSNESLLPYTKQFKIVIIATLDTGFQTFTNTENQFTITITPDCRADTLSL